MLTEYWSRSESVTAHKRSSALCQSPCAQERWEWVYGESYWFAVADGLWLIAVESCLISFLLKRNHKH